MDKKELVREAYINALEKKLEKARTSYEIAKKDTIEAEGRMVTRYDSTKTETAWLADGYLKEVKELEQCISDMREQKMFANISDVVFADLVSSSGYEKTVQYTLSRTESLEMPESLLMNLLGSIPGDIILAEKNKQHAEYHIKEIQKGSHKGKIAIGSIVTLQDDYGDKEQYYIVNYIGGMEVEVEGEDIFCISKQTPIAKAMLGKEKGEEVVLCVHGEERFRIEEIL